jgi:hypothetical protein
MNTPVLKDARRLGDMLLSTAKMKCITNLAKSARTVWVLGVRGCTTAGCSSLLRDEEQLEEVDVSGIQERTIVVLAARAYTLNVLDLPDKPLRNLFSVGKCPPPRTPHSQRDTGDGRFLTCCLSVPELKELGLENYTVYRTMRWKLCCCWQEPKRMSLRISPCMRNS